MQDDVTGQARDVDEHPIARARQILARELARQGGRDTFGDEDWIDAHRILAALAAAGLVIAPINPTAEMMRNGCGDAPDRQLLSRAIWGAMIGTITPPASPSPAADQEPTTRPRSEPTEQS